MRFCCAFRRAEQALLPETAAQAGSRGAREPSAPPSSRSTTQTAIRHSRPASRRASIAATAAPPEVTTSSIEADALAGLEGRLRGGWRSRTPWLPCGRSGTAGPTTSDAPRRARRPPARAPPAALRPARARRRAQRCCSPSGCEQVGPRLEAVLVEVVARTPTRAKHEVALEVGVLADARPRARRASLAAARSASRAYGSTRAASGEPPVERDHGAVREVEVDPLVPRGRAGRRGRCRAACPIAAPKARALRRPTGLCLRSSFLGWSLALASASRPARAQRRLFRS